MINHECGIRPGAIAVVLSVIVAQGAFAQKITTEFDEGGAFNTFKTFVVRDGQVNSPSPVLNSELTKKRIVTEIERALTGRGLTKATGTADVNVSFTFGSMRRMETETFPAGWRGRGTRVAQVPRTEGTLVIDLRDATTSSLVLRVIASEDEPNPAKLSDKIDDMVKKAIAKYPPRK